MAAAQEARPGGQVPAVQILLHPSPVTVGKGQTFTMDIVVGTGAQEVSGVQAYLNFDPDFLQVVDADGDPADQIQPGEALPTILVNSVANESGEIDYAAGTLGEPFASGTFVLASIRFKALEATPASRVSFSTERPRDTAVDFGGEPLPTNVIDGTVTVLISGVDISLEPPEVAVDAGQTFTMDIVVAAGEQPVSGAQVFLDFNPGKLQVQDADGDPDNGVQIQAGSGLPTVLANTADNQLGRIHFVAGKLSGPFPSGTILLATITFRAVEATPGTDITFATQTGRESFADFQGNPLPGALSGARVAIRVGLFAEPVDGDMTDQFIQVKAGETFDVDIVVAAGDQPVAGAQAFLDFDPGLLQVLDADPARPGVQVRPGNTLVDFQNVNLVDNSAGQIDYAAGNLAPPGGSGFPAGTFALATVRFRALSGTEGTPIAFSTSPATRETLVSAPGGEDVTGSLNDATVEVIPNAILRVSFRFQGGVRPRPDGWQQPVTVELVPTGGGDPIVRNLVSQFDNSNPLNVQAVATVEDVPFDTYDVYLTGPSTLTNVKRDVAIDTGDSGVITVDLGTLRSGNANSDGTRGGDQNINILDFGVLAGAFGEECPEEDEEGIQAFEFDPRADFDANCVVNINDFGLLSRNFLAVGPVEVGPAPAPPELTLRIVPTPAQGSPGDQVTVSVVADGAQDMAGVQFELHFDNTAVQAVSVVPGNLPVSALFDSNTHDGQGPVLVAASSATAFGIETLTIADIAFDLVGTAGTDLTFNNVIAGNQSAQHIPVAWVDGAINIE